MVGTLSQMIAICSAANGYLADRFASDKFFPGHAEFKFCNEVSFIQLRQNWRGKPVEATIARDPNAWLQRIKHDGATKATLHYCHRALKTSQWGHNEKQPF